MTELVFVVVLSAALLDGWRDALIKRRPGITWWRYHIVKWLAWYPALIVLTFAYIPGYRILLTILIAWVLWGLGARIGGANYSSMWLSKGTDE